MRRIVLLATLGTAFAIGCSDDKKAANLDEPTAGRSSQNNGGSAGALGGSAGNSSGNGGNGGSNETGGSGGTGGESTTVIPGAPIVSFTSPDSVLDPNADGVITTDTVTVKCKAEASDDADATVNVASTTILLSQSDSKLADVAADTTALVDGVRSATFDLVALGVTSGLVSFSCQAYDRSATPVKGTAQPLQLLVDRGPQLEITAPSSSSVVSLTSDVNFAFTAKESSLAEGDEKSAISSVTATVGGVDITVKENPVGSGNYEGRIPLTNRVQFSDSSAPFAVTTFKVFATNARGVVTEADQTFKVDGSAPKITMVDPAAPVIVGNNVTLKFKVEDGGAGVATDSIAVTLGNKGTYSYRTDQPDTWSAKDVPTYSFTFNAADILGTASTQVVVSITAADKVGNLNSDGASMVLYLDQKPPTISLDPPTVRDRHAVEGTDVVVCSNAFDPLGKAMNDRQIVTNADYYRALVWDETNVAREGLPRYYAGTDQTRVWLYVSNEVGNAELLVDTDNDDNHLCDDIVPSTVIPPIQLKPITPRGYAPWTNVTTETEFFSYDTPPSSGDNPPLDGCGFSGWNESPSEKLCGKSSDMVRVIQHKLIATKAEPVIYGLEPTSSSTDFDCAGRYLELAGLFTDNNGDGLFKTEEAEGWHCLAVKGIDLVGNRGVSRALRVCYDNPSTSYKPTCAQNVNATNPALSAEAPPSCTKSCTEREPIFTKLLDEQNDH